MLALLLWIWATLAVFCGRMGCCSLHGGWGGHSSRYLRPSLPPFLPSFYFPPVCFLSFRSSSSSPLAVFKPPPPQHNTQTDLPIYSLFRILSSSPFQVRRAMDLGIHGPKLTPSRVSVAPTSSSILVVVPSPFFQTPRTKTHIISPLPLFIFSYRCVAQWT